MSVEDIDWLTARVEVSGLEGMIGKIRKNEAKKQSIETPSKKPTQI
jgi:hypothetical protein